MTFKRELMAETTGTSGLPIESKSQDRVALILGVKDVVRTSEELMSKVVRLITRVIDRPDRGVRTIFLGDPDGNHLQLESEMEKDK